MHGCLRSATVMPGGAAFAGAIDIARRHEALGLGVHFTLVDGNPILPPSEIPSLVAEDGRFLSDHTALLRRYLKGGVNLEEVRRELAAQLRKVEATGVPISHVDSHQHMHVLPGIIDIVLDVLGSHGISAVRIPAIPVSLASTRFRNLGEQVGRSGLHVLAERARKKARARGFAMPDHFGGIVAGEAVSTAALRTLMLHLRDGCTEIMMHPGTDNKVLIPATEWDHDFQAELAAILDKNLQKLADDEQIQLINFTQLKA